MYIINQDRDEIFTLNDKSLLSCRIHVEDRYYNGQLVGWNVMGKRFLKKALLGTYDTEDDAKQVVQEIYKLLRSGCTYYAMPEPALDLEDLA